MQSFLGIRHKNIRFKRKICPFVLLSKEKSALICVPSHANPKRALWKIFTALCFLKIQLGSRKRPVGKIFFLNWKKIFSQLDNYFFSVGQFRMPFWMCFCTFLPLFLLILGSGKKMCRFEKYLQLAEMCGIRRRPYYEVVKSFEMRYLVCRLALVLSLGCYIWLKSPV